MNNKEIQQQINEISIRQFNGAVSSFNSLETIRRILINVKISVSKLDKSPDIMALTETASIIEEAIIKLEQSSGAFKESAKQIGQLINQLNVEE